jgi:hypothetical protein
MPELTALARCLRCGWSEAGDPDPVDKLAERHTDVDHPTATVMEPAS